MQGRKLCVNVAAVVVASDCDLSKKPTPSPSLTIVTKASYKSLPKFAPGSKYAFEQYASGNLADPLAVTPSGCPNTRLPV